MLSCALICKVRHLGIDSSVIDLLLDIVTGIGDWVVNVLFHLTGWHPDSETKRFIDWIGAFTAAFLGIKGVISLIRDGNSASEREH